MPRDVDDMRPSQIAAVLGLDEQDAVQLVPFPKELLDEAPSTSTVPTERPQLRLRRLIGGD